MYKEDINNRGFSTTPLLYSDDEIRKINSTISNWQNNNANEMQKQVYSIRRLLQQIPELKSTIFSQSLLDLISEIGDEKTFLVKAIYFDKPKNFNWFVSYHQDISITVNEKIPTEGYSKWTSKHSQIGVIPPESILENIFTIRIHLDETDKTNGALRVIPKSHLNGIQNVKEITSTKKNEVLCPVRKGHAMLMKPLTFHASSKSEMTNRRRVIHLEFTSQNLKDPIRWEEKLIIKAHNKV